MSESDLSEISSPSIPPDAVLERSLREAVLKAVQAEEEFSYRSIRTTSEAELGLQSGFYKGHEEWNQRSKNVIDDQIEKGNDTISPEKVNRTVKQNIHPRKVPSQTPAIKRGVKPTDPAPRKKRKISKELEESSEELSSIPSEASSNIESEDGTQNKRQASSASNKDKKTSSSIEKDEQVVEKAAVESSIAQSESEMSEVLDEEPKPRRKSSGKPTTKTKTSDSKTAKAKSVGGEDPDQAEIKRLQGWLVKCGIRKLWGKELKPFETSKAKIKHLKDMLADVGMTGRYSIEKANQIREARELAADIEAVQEGAERWGASGDDGDDGQVSGRAGRRLVRGAKNYDFLSSDGEETD